MVVLFSSRSSAPIRSSSFWARSRFAARARTHNSGRSRPENGWSLTWPSGEELRPRHSVPMARPSSPQRPILAFEAGVHRCGAWQRANHSVRPCDLQGLIMRSCSARTASVSSPDRATSEHGRARCDSGTQPAARPWDRRCRRNWAWPRLSTPAAGWLPRAASRACSCGMQRPVGRLDPSGRATGLDPRSRSLLMEQPSWHPDMQSRPDSLRFPTWPTTWSGPRSGSRRSPASK